MLVGCVLVEWARHMAVKLLRLRSNSPTLSLSPLLIVNLSPFSEAFSIRDRLRGNGLMLKSLLAGWLAGWNGWMDLQV